MRIIAGIPVRNNWLCIASLIYGADEHVDEIIVVDDGSEDKTVKITERTRTGATVIKQGNAGEGVAIRRLMEEAKKRDADALVLIEANCEYNTLFLFSQKRKPVLKEKMKGKTQSSFGKAFLLKKRFVIGSRFIGDEKEENKNKMLFARRFWVRVFSFMATRVAKAKVTVTDSQSGLRALSRYAMETIRTRIDGDGVKWEMVVNAAEQGLRVKEVDIGIWGDRISGGFD